MLKLAGCSFYETHNIYPNLNEQQFRLKKINGIDDCFVAEIKKRVLMSKRFSKYIASFDYFDKSSIILSVTTGSISIASFAIVIGVPVGMASASFSLEYSITTGIVKELLKTLKNKRRKHNKIFMLARSKLDSLESKISEAMINNEISHEDFTTIINEEKKYRELKESFGMMNSERSDAEKNNVIGERKKSRY